MNNIDKLKEIVRNKEEQPRKNIEEKYIIKAKPPTLVEYKKQEIKEIDSVEYNILGKVKKITYRRGK